MDNISSSNDTKKPLLRTSKLGSLRPSLFQSNNSSAPQNQDKNDNTNGDGGDSSAAALAAPDTTKLNPFLKCADSDDETTTSVPTTSENSKDEKTDPLALLSKNGLPKSNLFKNQPPSFTSSSSFVFGQNVHERVTGEQQPSSSTNELTSSEDKNDSDTSSSGLLFSSAVQKAPTTTQSNDTQTNSKSLQEAAREYEESRAQKRKFDEVETITGEEDENNVIEINCKLFAFVASTYEERGRGCLRMNDPKREGESSRVVFRTSGSLRVLLNTKIWSNMVAEKSSQKSLRLTAIDSNGQVKVFLIMARPDDVKRLHTLINHRINKEKRKEPLADKNLNEENKAIQQQSQPSSNEDDDWDKIEVGENKTETIEEPSPKKKHVESQNEVH